MTPAIALLVIGFIILKAGWSNQSIVDTALGRTSQTTDDQGSGGGSVPDGPGVTGLQHAPAGTTMIDGFPVANWIAPYVNFARRNGWGGRVLSGYRSLSNQTGLYNQMIQGKRAGPVAKPGESNHEYIAFPRGAIDVEDPDGFQRALNHFVGPVPLRRDPTIGDPTHFSFTGR